MYNFLPIFSTVFLLRSKIGLIHTQCLVFYFILLFFFNSILPKTNFHVKITLVFARRFVVENNNQDKSMYPQIRYPPILCRLYSESSETPLGGIHDCTLLIQLSLNFKGDVCFCPLPNMEASV